MRKVGKLPAEKINHQYKLEYGTDTIEIHKDALENGTRVILIDELLATGGTALAGAALVEKLGGIIGDGIYCGSPRCGRLEKTYRERIHGVLSDRVRGGLKRD